MQKSRGFQRVESPGFKGGGKKGKRRFKGKGRGKDSKGGKDSFYADEWYDWDAEAWVAWSEYGDDAYTAEAGLRCGDCGRLGHANSSSPYCPRHVPSAHPKGDFNKGFKGGKKGKKGGGKGK